MRMEEHIKERRRESLKGSFKKRRGKLEIIIDILSVAMKEAKKTEIVYKANLNFKRVGKYLPYLEEKGLIENMGSEYKTTGKGKQFLRDYRKMKEQLK